MIKKIIKTVSCIAMYMYTKGKNLLWKLSASKDGPVKSTETRKAHPYLHLIFTENFLPLVYDFCFGFFAENS